MPPAWCVSYGRLTVRGSLLELQDKWAVGDGGKCAKAFERAVRWTSAGTYEEAVLEKVRDIFVVGEKAALPMPDGRARPLRWCDVPDW